MPSHGIFLFLSLPPEQSIDGLEFHQLIYKRLLAYQIDTDGHGQTGGRHGHLFNRYSLRAKIVINLHKKVLSSFRKVIIPFGRASLSVKMSAWVCG